MANKFTRRDFIKIGALAATSFAFRDFPPGGDPSRKRAPSYSLGRTVYSLRYYEKPSFSSNELGYYVTDTVVEILEEQIGDPKPAHNPVWLRTKDGWVHSAYVQPVQNQENEPIEKIPAGGRLFEVTVPFTQAWMIKDNQWKRKYRFYYSSTHWVTYAFQGVTGEYWYQVLDDRYGDIYVVKAKDLRAVLSEELTPISPNCKDKLVEIDLAKQRLIAYEDSQPVFTTRIATGYFEGDTPKGEFFVERKQSSRHMASNLQGNEFDLPGVPWVCYISWTGVSLHGTYWHHNYGTPQSHGCINLLPEAAKWVYCWTNPYVPVEKDYFESDYGTRVVVF